MLVGILSVTMPPTTRVYKRETLDKAPLCDLCVGFVYRLPAYVNVKSGTMESNARPMMGDRNSLETLRSAADPRREELREERSLGE